MAHLEETTVTLDSEYDSTRSAVGATGGDLILTRDGTTVKVGHRRDRLVLWRSSLVRHCRTPVTAGTRISLAQFAYAEYSKP